MIYSEEIEKEILKEYGINIKLDNYEKMLTHFKKMIMVDNFYNYKNDRNGRIISIKINEKGREIDDKKFKLVKHIGEGSFNRASIFEDDQKVEYVVKESKSGIFEFDSTIDLKKGHMDTLFDGFYENIKHVVLYIITTIKLQ